LRKLILEEHPTDIVCFHFGVTPFVKTVLQNIPWKVNFTVIVTDPFTLPKAWFYERDVNYLVYSEDAKQVAVTKCNVPEKNVKVIPTLCENGDIAIAVFNYSKNTAKRNGTININLKVKLPYGEYSVSHYRIDKNNCNSYSAWTELGQPEYPTQNEAEVINKAAILKKWYEDEEIKGDEYSLDIQMSDYSVSLLKLKSK
jgi:beta-xylosidase